MEKEYVQKLERLTEIGLEINSILTSTDALKTVAKHIAELVGAEHSLFLLWNVQGSNLAQAHSYGFEFEHGQALTMAEIESGISGWVKQTGKAVLIENAQADERNTGEAYESAVKHNTGPLIVVPLQVQKTVVGTLTAVNLLGQPCFTPQDKNLLIMLANQVARVLENKWLFEESQQQQQLLRALDEASRHIRAEKEPEKLLQEILRLAIQLIGFEVGGLFVNTAHFKQLRLEVTYRLPKKFEGVMLSHDEGLVGLAVIAGSTQTENNYVEWKHRRQALDSLQLKTAVAVPIKQATGRIDAVLFMAHRSERPLTPLDQEILQRFIVQAAIAYRTSRLLSREQRMYGQLTVLNKISNYIQASRDLDKILHVILTGITAGYGLGFNRAALLLLDSKREHLIGRLGIGHFQWEKAQRDWHSDRDNNIDGFEPYLRRLEKRKLPSTPLEPYIRQLKIQVDSQGKDCFSHVILQQCPCHIDADQLNQIPSPFIEAFQPETPLILIPLLVRRQVIGLLAADNKFTGAPITDEVIESLTAFAHTAAVAIDNIQLYAATEAARLRLHNSFKASNTLISSKDPEHILTEIVEQTRRSAKAAWSTMLLIQPTGHVRKRISTFQGINISTKSQMRPNGLSMQVMATGQHIIIENSTLETERINKSMLERKVGAAVCFPLSFQEVRIGVMWLHYTAPRRFSPSEIEALQLYVNQAAIAYNSAQRIHELKHMRQAADALAGAADLQTVLRQIVRSAQAVLESDSAVIWSYDPVQQQFVLENSVAVGITPEWWEEAKLAGPRPAGTANTVIRRGWVGVEDIEDDYRYPFLGGPTYALLKKIEAKSFQGIVLSADGGPLGVLYVNYNQHRFFSKDEQETARTFANHASLALRKAKLVEKLTQARNTASVLAGVTTLGDLQKTLALVVTGTVEVIGCDALTIYTYDPETSQLTNTPTHYGLDFPERVSRFPKIEPNSLIPKMLEQDEPVVVARNSENIDFAQTRFSQEERIKSCVAIPLKVKKDKVGVMFVNFRHEHHFTENEMADMRLFADQAAVAIHNAQLYEKIQRQHEVSNAMQQVAMKLTRVIGLDKVLETVMEEALALTSIQGGNILLWDEEENDFSHTLKTEEQGRLRPYDSEARPENGLAKRIIREKITVNIPDARQVPDFNKAFLDKGHRATLGVPLLLDGIAIGVLFLRSDEPHHFTPREVKLVEALAGQAAIAIDRAQIKGVIGNHTVVEWINMVSESWGHDINREVGTALRRIKLLQSEPVSKRGKKQLERLATDVEKIGNIPQTLPPSSTTASYIAINDLLKSFQKQWHLNRYESVDLRYDLEPELEKQIAVWARPLWLRYVFEQVINNAVVAMHLLPKRQLTIQTRLKNDRQVSIFITDTGKGIDPAIQNKLFNGRIEWPQRTGKSGKGLMLAQSLVQTYRGDIGVERTDATGTTIRITLPIEHT